LPQVGASCLVTLAPEDAGGEPVRFRFTVTELDGKRAARVKIAPEPELAAQTS
jgi:hypothetical protein